MDGFEATALIRTAEKRTSIHVPIVALTAHAMKGDRERCLQRGMEGHLAKPIRAQELEKFWKGTCLPKRRLIPFQKTLEE
jgi:two-component system, sensor histidine kinase and response regulator